MSGPAGRQRRDGACVALQHDGATLVVRTSRYPEVWQPVGGGLQPGEDARTGAVREILEETGMTLDGGALTYVLELPMDAHPGTVTFFRADCPTREIDVDPAEIAEHRWVENGQLEQLPAFDAAAAFFAALAAELD